MLAILVDEILDWHAICKQSSEMIPSQTNDIGSGLTKLSLAISRNFSLSAGWQILCNGGMGAVRRQYHLGGLCQLVNVTKRLLP